MFEWEQTTSIDPSSVLDRRAWLTAGRVLRDRVAAEMGPDVDVFFPTFRSEVVNAFQSWLTGRGWSLVGAKDEGQIQARQPGGKTIVAVVGEHSAAQRQSIDHPDGRLLRAMNLARADSQHAIVVPQSLINRCLEVSAEVRASG